jgi:hypothetical protein
MDAQAAIDAVGRDDQPQTTIFVRAERLLLVPGRETDRARQNLDL